MPTATPPGSAPTRPGWCYWHGDSADDVALIDLVERSSGPPAARTACWTCVAERGLTPYDERVSTP